MSTPRIPKSLAVTLLMLLAAAIIVHANYNKPFFVIDDEDHFQTADEKSALEHFIDLKPKYTYLPVELAWFRLDKRVFFTPLSAETATHPAYPGAEMFKPGFAGAANWAPPLRIENALCHALAGVILWLLLSRLGATPGVALFVALAWAVHPMACESVSWICERKNVLAALFGFAALLAQTARGKPWRWPLVTFLFLLATLSKPVAVGLFPLIAALEFDAVRTSATGKGRALAGLLGPLAVTLFIVAAGVTHHVRHFVDHAGGSLFTALLSDVEILSRYLRNIAIPTNLSFFYTLTPITTLADPRLWIFGTTALAVIAATILAAAKPERKLAIIGWIWFFCAWAPVANIAPIPYWMQDRYIYLSAPGFLLALACAARGLCARVRLSAMIPGICVVLLLAALTFQRSYLFTDMHTLAVDAIARFPQSGMAHYSLGAEYLARVKLNPQAPSAERTANAQHAVEELKLAAQCPDIRNFVEAFELRIKTADMLLQSRQFDAAEDYLRDWLPPKHLTMWTNPNEPMSVKYGASHYVPQTLAFAWIYAAEARLQRALTLFAARAPLNQVAENALAAADAADNSLAVHPLNFESHFVKAKVLLLLTDIDTAAKQKAAAKTHYAQARQLLEMIPKNAELHKEAAKLLDRSKPPEE